MNDHLCGGEEIIHNQFYTGPFHLCDAILNDHEYIESLMTVTLAIDPTGQSLCFHTDGEIDEEAMLAICERIWPDRNSSDSSLKDNAK